MRKLLLISLLIIAMTALAFYNIAFATTNPIVWYKFDETSGTTAADSSGNGKNATLVNGPTWVAGKSGNAVNLDGTNDHVSMPSGIVSTLNDFSIATWVKLDTSKTWYRIFDIGTGQNVYMFLTSSCGSTNVVRFAITTGSYSAEQKISGTAALPTGSWKHVAVTLSGSTGTLYVDGVQVGTNTAMTLKPSSLGSTTQNWIGRSMFSADPYMDGQVDDFRIYDRALSAAEVQALYGGPTPTPTPTSTPTPTPGPTFTPGPTATPGGYTAYLLTYFTNSNSAVHFAYSRDALHWTALNNNLPVLYSNVGTKMIRDPFVIRGNDNVFHLLGTDNWASKSIVAYDSTDLTTWTGERLVAIAPSTATFAWAPESMWDSSVGKYRIYFASDLSSIHKLYSVTTSDYKTVSAPTLFYDPGSGLYAIDGTIMPYNGSFYMFFKYSDSGPVGVGIQRLQASSVAGPWSNRSGPLTDVNVEGPTIFKDNTQNKWYLYYDYYSAGYWGCSTATDVSGTWTALSPSATSLPAGVRHGNIIPITDAELARLDAKW